MALHRHTHPTTGAPGGWHDENIVHAMASKHAYSIETKLPNGTIVGSVSPPLKGYTPATHRAPLSARVTAFDRFMGAGFTAGLMATVSKMKVSPAFEKWAKGFSGCDGGNLYGPVWFCGIEWGAGEKHDLDEEVRMSVSEPPQIYDAPEVILKYQYGKKLLKLITAMRGNAVSDYLDVANETPFPFHRDSDFFKLNLFPVAFQHVDPRLWGEKYAATTGLSTREEYLEWCRNNRFPAIRSWMQRGEPKLVVGVGRSQESDFRMAFGFNGRENVETNVEIIEGLRLVWMSNGKAILAVIPFLGFQNGLLNSDRLLQAFGERLGAFLS